MRRRTIRFATHWTACLAACLAVFFLALAAPAFAAPSLSQLEKDLQKEQEKAVQRRKSLQRLTDEERRLNASLATAEKRILELEQGLEVQEDKLRELTQEDKLVRADYEGLRAEQENTEAALAETLRLLWELTARRMAVGGREMIDWAEVDREYLWSRELYGELENYRRTLVEQETKINAAVSRRSKISRDVESRLSTVNAEKRRLLQARLSYQERLDEVRKSRAGAEEELTRILALVDSLNFQIVQQSANRVETMKGKLPWPVKGEVRQRYAPGASPPSRGLSIATTDGAAVLSIAGGKVVHNSVLRGFGTVLILQHGDDYYSLYAFLGSSPLRLGQDVPPRQEVGRTGFYPGINGPGLYFELRFKQKAINPEQWLGSR